MTLKVSIYNEGYGSYKENPKAPNPYLIDTCSYSAWQKGYDDAHSNLLKL